MDAGGSSTGRGNLYDPHLRGNFDAVGNEIPGTRDGDGRGENARVIFGTDAGGIYYVVAGTFGNGEGTCTLSVKDVNE